MFRFLTKLSSLNRKEVVMYDDIASIIYTVWKKDQHKKFFMQFWLFMINEVMLELLKNCFYITENSNNKQQYFYYRRKQWLQMKSKGWVALANSGHRPQDLNDINLIHSNSINLTESDKKMQNHNHRFKSNNFSQTPIFQRKPPASVHLKLEKGPQFKLRLFPKKDTTRPIISANYKK